MCRLAAIIAIALCSVGTGTANAFSTGQFSHATATSDWSRGSFAGSVNWTDCNAGCDSYLVLVYNEPAVYTCHASDWKEESDPNIRQVWNSGSQTSNRTIPIEANDVELLPGIYGQRLCMIGIQSTETEFGTFVSQQLVASTLFQVESPPPPPAPPAASVESPAAATKPPATAPARVCKRLRKKLRRSRQRLRSARRQGKTRRAARIRRTVQLTARQQRARC